MKKKTVQRIKLRCEGSPVKFDGSIIAASPDGKRIRVEFDGPLEDVELVSIGAKMASNMTDREGKPTDDFRMATSCQVWEVLA